VILRTRRDRMPLMRRRSVDRFRWIGSTIAAISPLGDQARHGGSTVGDDAIGPRDADNNDALSTLGVAVAGSAIHPGMRRDHSLGNRRTARPRWPRVESRRGAVARTLRFLSPLVKRSVRICRTALSDWFHLAAVGSGPRWTRRRSSTPYSPYTTSPLKRRVPSDCTL
jgi:hypothetical protein